MVWPTFLAPIPIPTPTPNHPPTRRHRLRRSPTPASPCPTHRARGRLWPRRCPTKGCGASSVSRTLCQSAGALALPMGSMLTPRANPCRLQLWDLARTPKRPWVSNQPTPCVQHRPCWSARHEMLLAGPATARALNTDPALSCCPGRDLGQHLLHSQWLGSMLCGKEGQWWGGRALRGACMRPGGCRPPLLWHGARAGSSVTKG